MVLERLILQKLNTKSLIVTETNLPGKQNLSYFGDNDEAHWIYNFSLPPLIAYTLLFEDSSQISNWTKSMPPTRNGQTYLNFLASHDGIGMRPIEGILNKNQSIWICFQSVGLSQKVWKVQEQLKERILLK